MSFEQGPLIQGVAAKINRVPEPKPAAFERARPAKV